MAELNGANSHECKQYKLREFMEFSTRGTFVTYRIALYFRGLLKLKFSQIKLSRLSNNVTF